MKRATLIITAVLAFSDGISARPVHDPVAWFSARAVQMASPARLAFPRADIRIYQWSTDLDHRTLARTILESGPMGFSHLLAGYPSLGTISTAGSEFTIRYAWQAPDRDHGRRIYLATDEPIVLLPREFRRFAEPEALMFMELRLNEGIGKLSDSVRLSVDQSRNVIELREWDRRPVQLMMVRDEMAILEE